MDVDALLNIEKRTGIKDTDIDDFLSKANAVEAAIRGMKDGTLDPDQVKVPGILSDEEIATKEAERKENERRQVEKKEKLRLQRKVEEKERWWGGADLFRKEEEETREAEARGVIDDDGTGAKAKKDQIKARYDFDYSRWDTWTPEDPVTKAEAAEREQEAEKTRNAEFEKNNAEFCDNFTSDMKERQKKVEKKQESADVMRIKGNREFKRQDYATALVHYMDALKVLPYETKTLLNIAQVNIKQKNFEDALEFVERAIYLDGSHIKALYRKTLVLTEIGNTTEALLTAKKALKLDPENKDIQKQHTELSAIHKDEEQEKEVTALAEKAEAKLKAATSKKESQGVTGTPTPNLDPTDPNALEAMRGMSLDELTTLFEESMGGFVGGDEGGFQTFNSVHKALKEGRIVGSVPEAPSGMPTLPDAPKTYNVFDALCEIMEADAKMRVYFRTSGALALSSVCLRNMLQKLAPETGLGHIKAGEWTGTGEDPTKRDASIFLINAIFTMLSVACRGERGIKVSLLEDGCIVAAKQVVMATAAPEQMDGLRYTTFIDGKTNRLAGALPGALRLLEQCGDSEEAPKVADAVCKDKELPHAIGKLLGQLSIQIPAAPKKTDGFKLMLSVGDGLAEVAAIIVKSTAGQKHAVESGGGGLIVCGLGSMLASLDARSEVGLIGAVLQALSECSRVSALQAFFAVPLPSDDSSSPPGCTATSILGITEGLCTAAGITGPVATTKVTNLQKTLLDCALALLMNACLDKDAGPDSVRGTLAANGAVELTLQASSTCVTRTIQKITTPTARQGDLTPDGRLFAGLLSRLTGVQGVQRALALPGPFRLLCKMVAKVETVLREGGVTGPMKDTLEATMGHFVTTLAHLTKFVDETRAVAAEEGLMRSLFGAFPEPRREFGSVTPDSVTKMPANPANAVLLGNAAMCIKSYADDDTVGQPVFADANALAVEKLICAMATCTNISVRKNIATVLAKACKHPGVKDKMVKFKGMQIIRELNNHGQI